MLKSMRLRDCCAVLFLAAACGSTGSGEAGGPFGIGSFKPTGGDGDGTGAGDGIRDVDGGGTVTGSGGSPGGTIPDSCTPSAITPGCVGEVYAGENVPLDIYIMFDQSCSMSCPVSTTGRTGQCCMDGSDRIPGDARIHPTLEAVDEFLTDPESAGIGVGIGYFGYMPLGETVCQPGPYSDAAVEVGQLPDHAAPLLDSLYGVLPTGETPTGSAIRGACIPATAWHEQNPGHAVVILLVTDGVPESGSSGCNPSVADSAAAAAECLQDSGIETYVLGIGLAFDNLNQIAEGGGTDEAYLVEGTTQSVLEALNAIRGAAAIPCDLQIPPPPEGETLNYSQVNIGVCNAAEQVVVTYYVETPEGCDPDQGGWYYDDPDNPERILLCGPTCETVRVPGAQLFYTVGCDTQTVPIE